MRMLIMLMTTMMMMVTMVTVICHEILYLQCTEQINLRKIISCLIRLH